MTLVITKINESFSQIEGTEQELIKISDFFKVEREGQYFDPLVKRGFKSPYDFFTTGITLNGKKALLVMNGLLEIHPVLSDLIKNDTAFKKSTGFSENDVKDFLKDLEEVLPFKPYNYQAEQIVDILSNSEKQISRLCTGSGKSIIISCIQEFFRQRNKKGILLVPNINLLTQFFNDIKDYNLEELADSVELIGGEHSVKNVSELTKTLTISTWQSMKNFEGTLDGIDFVIQDECLHPDTLIETLNGSKRIEDIEVNDSVLCYNESTNQKEYKKVLKKHKNLSVSSKEKMFLIKTENGQELKITGNHKVLTKDGWKRQDTLDLNDEILTLFGEY